MALKLSMSCKLLKREKNEQLRTLRKEINHLQGQKETKSAEFTRLLSLIKERNSKVGRSKEHCL